MIRNELLLQGNPTYVLAPHIELTQNIVTKPDKENSEGPFNCDGCGKALDSEYYISFGIPPSPLIVETYLCKSLSCEKNIDSQIVSWIRSRATIQNIDSEYQWIFSEQNIMGSKTRLCADCKREYKWEWRGWEIPDIHKQWIYRAVEEYQRCHTPISTARSDYERYILSLPNRSNLILQYPKALEHPKRRDDGKEVYSTRYTVVVHYSVPKGDWDEFDV